MKPSDEQIREYLNVGCVIILTGVDTMQMTRTGTSGDFWRSGEFYIRPSDGNMVTVSFIARRGGSGYNGDISLDDVKFVPGKKCSFRSESEF